ncbi:hypothetical protein NDU88_005829 [Pleurodeles waltl]|uniref:Uncharacterized protein n=1 Tax=Pleurodeles waltl TaxID=8319 RepID=A0AAV7L3P0_PLEWA|nr:hypothetical protein NDU88_005829 [Pleurodeles waltl]
MHLTALTSKETTAKKTWLPESEERSVAVVARYLGRIWKRDVDTYYPGDFLPGHEEASFQDAKKICFSRMKLGVENPLEGTAACTSTEALTRMQHYRPHNTGVDSAVIRPRVPDPRDCRQVPGGCLRGCLLRSLALPSAGTPISAEVPQPEWTGGYGLQQQATVPVLILPPDRE